MYSTCYKGVVWSAYGYRTHHKSMNQDNVQETDKTKTYYLMQCIFWCLHTEAPSTSIQSRRLENKRENIHIYISVYLFSITEYGTSDYNSNNGIPLELNINTVPISIGFVQKRKGKLYKYI